MPAYTGKPCARCGQPLAPTVGRGRPPKYHPECARPDAQKDRITGFETISPDVEDIRAGNAAKARARKSAIESAELAREVTSARMLAVTLSLYPDSPEDAARLAGIAATGDDLLRLIERAKSESHRGIREGDHETLTLTVRMSLMLLAQKLLSSVNELQAKDIPFALRVIGQVADEMGATSPVPTEVTVVHRGDL